MKVFVPHKKDRNVYFDEIINFSKSEFTFGNFKDFNTNYDIVNIQFPEAIFDMVLPTKHQLQELETELLLWKKHSKIIFTLNDAKSHYDLENKYDDLFNLLQKYVDGVIHLGNHSLENYSKYFSKVCKHVVVFHPLYESLLINFKAENIESKFLIDLQDKYVVAVIGAIRSMEEVRLIFKIFKQIPNKNKLLIVPNMYPFWQLPPYLPYRTRKIYKKMMLFFYCFPLKKDQFYFEYKFLEYPFIIDLVKKSSLIVIPRLKNLNSGNLFLGLTFNKPMIIPKIGNLIEVANSFNFPLLDVKFNNFEDVLKKMTSKENENFLKSDEYLTIKKKFHPKEIANEYDLFFDKITKD